MTQEEIRSLFSSIGEVKSCKPLCLRSSQAHGPAGPGKAVQLLWKHHHVA